MPRLVATAPLTAISTLAATAMLVASATGCLPGDERPVPSSVLLNVNRSDAVAEGFVTDDGWHVTFDRFVTALGGVPLGRSGRGPGSGEDCVDYSFSTYDRLYDFTVAGTSKVVLHYGLGRCTIPFSLRQPSPEAILMAGVTSADLELMGPEDSDMFEKNEASGVGLLLVGRAEREGVTKQFSWHLAANHLINECYAPFSDEVVNTIDLYGEDAHVRQLEIRPQELFRVTPSLEAAIEFGRFAEADADGDDTITLAELAEVDVPFDQVIEDLLDELPDDFKDEKVGTLFDEATLLTLVRDILSRRVAAFEGAGECEAGSDF